MGKKLKFLTEKNRAISICLSLAILSLAVVISTKDERQSIWISLAFFNGGLMYGISSIREWILGRRPLCFIYLLISVLMVTCLILYLFKLRGMIGN